MDNETIKSIANTLSEGGFTEQDIWDANPALSPVLRALESKLDSLKRAGATVMVSVDFTQCDDLSKHGFTKKVYKIDPTKNAWQTVALIFTKIGPALTSGSAASGAGLSAPSAPSLNATGSAAGINGGSTSGALNHRRFCLRTFAGNILDDNEPLSHYGLGSLFHCWDLVMIRKTAEQFAAARPISGVAEGGKYLVTFLPGDGPMFNGISKLTKNIHSDTPTGQLIANFCKRYNIPNPENFALASTGDLLLSRNQSLGYYGLGKKIDRMTVKLVLRDEAAEAAKTSSSSNPSIGSSPSSSSHALGGSTTQRAGVAAPVMSGGFNASSRPSSRSHRHSVLISPDVAWTQLDDHLSVREAQAVILDLDKQLAESKHSLTASNQQRAEEREAFRKLVLKERESYSELEAQHDQLRRQAKQLVDVYADAKGKNEDLLVVNSSLEAEVVRLQGEMTRLQGDIGNMRALMGRARDELMTVRTESANKSDQIGVLQGELLAQKVELEELKMGLELKISSLDRELQEETKKTLALYSEQIAMQDEIETQQAALTKLRSEKIDLETGLTAASLKEAQLSSEVSQLKKEVANAQYGEQQAKAAIESTAEEISILNAQVDAMAAERRAHEHTLASTKASLTATIDELDADMRKARAEIESARGEKRDAELQYEAQVRNLKEALEKSQQESLHYQQKAAGSSTPIVQAPVTVVQTSSNANSAAAAAEIESLKSQKQSLSERLEASASEAVSLKRQLAEAKTDAEVLRAQIREGGAIAAASSAEALESLKRQLNTAKEQLSAEQKTSFEAKQSNASLSEELAQVSSQHATSSAKVVQLAEELRTERADYAAKREAAVAAEKERAAEMNAKITKVTTEKAEVERQLKDTEQRVKDVLGEKAEVEKQYLETTQTVKEQASLIKEQKETIIRLETPPPAPFIAATLRIEARKKNPNQPEGKGGSLEDEILGIKDTLQKIDTSALSKKKDFSNDNMLSNLLMSGLEKRFKATRDDEVEDLASDDIYIPNDNEEDWK